MDKRIVYAGNNGEKDRSDCRVALEITASGGIQIELVSKVKSLYGDTIIRISKEVLKFFLIEHAKLIIEDKGALDFVICARLEAAIKQVVKTDKEFLPTMLNENLYTTAFDRPRFSRLYLPGNTPSLMINSGIHKSNGIILDLEDAVAEEKKNEARCLVRNALRSLDFLGSERMVRINQLPMGLEDLYFIVPHNVNLILVPKCEHASQIHQVNESIEKMKRAQPDDRIWLMPIIESALGVMNAFEIAKSATNVVAIAIGLEDYTADIGVHRTAEGKESLFARMQLVNVCKAAGIQAIDSVFSDVGDLEGLKRNVEASKALGFDGMGCIHPRQVKIINDNFLPSHEEIEKAKIIVTAFMEAKRNGLGVVSIGTKMVDAPVVKRAQRVIDLAVSNGVLDAKWSNN
ncbi:MAG: aldolase/citrate lyase family protein [Cyclobacteriaceae bacterium]|nr:MAG: aldolase/citrate lyase family protein [Cyclobacteriaceae bacterium]